MPAFIQTKGDEKRWSKAKAAASKQLSESDGDKFWALTNHIYQQMTKSEVNDDSLIKADENDTENLEDQGMSIIDTPDEAAGDDADQWLKEHEGKSANVSSSSESEDTSPAAQIEPKKTTKGSGYSDWKPRDDYSDEHKQAIDQHVSQGYSPREAERMAGAHQGPSDFQSALRHTVRPSQPSNKMLGDLKGIASEWIDNARRYEMANADIEKNPVKYATGKIIEEHEKHHKDFNDAYSKFLSSPDIQGLKGKARFDAVNGFKKQWKDKNPEHASNQIEAAVASQSHAQDAAATQRKTFQEKMHHIMSGGAADPSMTVSAEEAGQHLGIGKESEEGGHRATTIKDPLASFAHDNPKLLNVLRQHASPEQMDRFHRVNSAKAAVSSKPTTILRRK